MAKSKKFHTIVILDCSGSMSGVREKTISGFNEYIQSLKKDDGDMILTFATFDGEYRFGNAGNLRLNYVHDGIQVKDVPELTLESYAPDGSTPLIDAVATVINKVSADYADKKKKPKFMVMIITDGEENSSREFTSKALTELVQSKEKEGWLFGYLGANQEAWKVAESIGLKRESGATYTASNIKGAFKYAALNTTDARRAHPANVRWSGEALEELSKEDNS